MNKQQQLCQHDWYYRGRYGFYGWNFVCRKCGRKSKTGKE